MDYGNFIKEKYMKMALKGTKLPLEKQWEKSLIGVQCLFALHAKLADNALAISTQIDEEFNYNFSNGLSIPFDEKSKQIIPIYLKMEHYLKVMIYLISTILPKLSEPIIQAKDEIDNEIYNKPKGVSVYGYFTTKKNIMEGGAEDARIQIKQIENSLHDCFKNDQAKVEEIRKSMAETYNKVNADVKSYVEKFTDALDLNEIVFDEGVLNDENK